MIKVNKSAYESVYPNIRISEYLNGIHEIYKTYEYKLIKLIEGNAAYLLRLNFKAYFYSDNAKKRTLNYEGTLFREIVSRY